MEKNDEKKSEESKLIERLKQYRKKFEARWYIASAFYDGFHFSWGKQDNDGNWIQTPTPKGKVLRMIPKAKKHLNGIRNMMLKIRLKPVVYPDKQVLYDMSDDPEAIKAEEEQAAKVGSYVDHKMMEELKLMTHRKKLIRYAQLYGHSFIQLINNGDGNYELEVLDPFEMSVPFGINQIKDVACKHVSKRLSELKENKKYDQDALKTIEASLSGKYSDSKFKESMLSEKYGNAPDDLVLIDELYKVVDGKVIIKSYIGQELVKEEKTNLTRISTSMFVWDDESYQTSLMEDFMPLNRSYDMLVSKLEHKAKKIDTGRILMQKRETMKPVTTNDGEIIRYSRIKPEIMQESQIGQAFISILQNLESDMREQGVAISTGGDIPAGVKAWRAIEALKENDYNGIGQQIENLQDCLTDLAEKFVDMVASELVTTEVVQVPKADEQGKTEVFGVIGKQGAEVMQNKPDSLVVVDPNRKVKVEMESTLGYTEEGKRGIILELIEAQLLPAEMAIEMLRFGNTRDIIKKLEEQQTKGQSLIDMPDFKLLPKVLQAAIAQYLSQGGVINDPNVPLEEKANLTKQ